MPSAGSTNPLPNDPVRNSSCIAAVQASNAGNYTVTATNIAGTVTSAAATLTLAPLGVDLALGKAATASSYEDQGAMPASAVTDGDLTTRWGSAFSDPQWIEVDLGAVMSFNRIILQWQAAYAAAYQIQVSNDNTTWTTAYTQTAGTGGTDDFSFAAVQARYVRMYGTQRNTQCGYSLFEFSVYNAAACGGSTERYTVLSPTTIVDNLSQLEWSRTEYTLSTGSGAQLTQPLAAQYCAASGMRLPTQDEALAISSANSASCAFPQAWNTWTSTYNPQNNTYAYWVASTGGSNLGVANNLPGWALCTQGTTAVAPTSVRRSTVTRYGRWRSMARWRRPSRRRR
jgi:beta-galactosidase